MPTENQIFALLDCADDSILQLNPLIDHLGYRFTGYDYDSFVQNKFKHIIDESVAKSLNNDSLKGKFIIDGIPQKRNSGVLSIVKLMGITVDFNRTSWRNKIYFFEKDELNTVNIHEANYRITFEIICSRLQKVLSIYLEHPLRMNMISAVGNGKFRYRPIEKAIFSYPNRRILSNNSIHGTNLTEDTRFKRLLLKCFDKIKIRDSKNPREFYGYQDIDYSITGYEYVDLAIDLYNLANETAIENANYLLNLKTKFTLLISSFESLFNFNPVQISHTLARHYSVLFWNPSLFQKNYLLMKYCYDLRSKFIHGSDNKSLNRINNEIHKNIKKMNLNSPSDLAGLVEELNGMVKIAIQLVLLENKSKEQLFYVLNARGQDPNESYSESPISPKP